MTYQLSSFRRFPSAFAIAAASVLAFGGLMASTSPAYAQGSDYRCAGLADQAESAAATASAGERSSAKRFVSTGKKLCAAGNERAAAKQFRAALKISGVPEVQGESQIAAR